LQLDALIRRKEILNLDYQRLALRTMGLTGGGNVQPVTVEDLTPEPPNSLLNGGLGLIGGLGLALVAMVVTSRARREVWLPTDLPIPLLGVVPDRRTENTQSGLWYDHAEGGRRKESIQAVRTAIEGVLDDGPAGVALVADGMEARAYHDLAIDLAAAFASSGRRVLLIDADYTSPGAGGHHEGEPSLRTLLDPPADAKEQYKDVGAALGRLTQMRADLAILPAGAMPTSPADTLAGQPLRVLLDEARARFDLVILVAGPAGSATAQVISSRIGTALVAITPGRSTVPDLERLVVDFAYQRVEPIGAVMMQRRRRIRTRVAAPRVSVPRVSVPRVSVPRFSVPKPRLDRAPKESRVPSRSTQPSGQKAQGGMALRRIVEDLSDHEVAPEELSAIGSVEGARELGDELINALRSAHPGHAYESIATYLVTRVEDMLTSVGSRVGMADRLGDVLIRYGFIPLTRVPGHRSMGEWLLEDLRWELGATAAGDLISEFARLLDSDSDTYPSPLDAWLADEFFRRHLERTHMEPEVWHLTSEKRTVQVLAYGRALDRERLNRLETDVVLRTSTLLEQRLTQGSRSQAGKLNVMIKDVQLFRVTLELLQRALGEDEDDTHHWRRRDSRKTVTGAPWVDGVSPNIAHFQRFGLLVVPVLTDEEMVALEQAG
jgi:Mrp family chromosome partitioning ATPase